VPATQPEVVSLYSIRCLDFWTRRGWTVERGLTRFEARAKILALRAKRAPGDRFVHGAVREMKP